MIQIVPPAGSRIACLPFGSARGTARGCCCTRTWRSTPQLDSAPQGVRRSDSASPAAEQLSPDWPRSRLTVVPVLPAHSPLTTLWSSRKAGVASSTAISRSVRKEPSCSGFSVFTDGTRS